MSNNNPGTFVPLPTVIFGRIPMKPGLKRILFHGSIQHKCAPVLFMFMSGCYRAVSDGPEALLPISAIKKGFIVETFLSRYSWVKSDFEMMRQVT